MDKPVLVKLTLRQGAKGPVYYLVYTLDGRRIRESLRHGDLKKAESQRDYREQKINRSVCLGDPGADVRTVRLSGLCKSYLAANARLEPSTRSLTGRAFDYLVNAVGGDMFLQSFMPVDAERFQKWLIGNRGLNQTSANVYVKTVRPAFRWAREVKQWIVTRPFAGLKLFRPKKNRIRILEAEECIELMDACPSEMWLARIILAKSAGLRRGEVLNLTRDEVDYRNGVIYLQPKEETSTTWRWMIKDKDSRELPLVPELAVLLKSFEKCLPDDQPYLMLDPDHYYRRIIKKRKGLLSDSMRCCPENNFQRTFREIADSAGLCDVTFHDLRRTCITSWLEMGLKPHEVMALAGHSSIDTTMRYYVSTRKSLLDRARDASATRVSQVAPNLPQVRRQPA